MASKPEINLDELNTLQIADALGGVAYMRYQSPQTRHRKSITSCQQKGLLERKPKKETEFMPTDLGRNVLANYHNHMAGT